MPTRRYSITAVKAVLAELEEWLEASQETLDNAESADYPNDDRIDKLTTRCDSLQEAIDALENIE